MTSPLFDSIYLAEQPRRARLSEARDRIRDRSTVAPEDHDPRRSHASTVHQPGGLLFWIQDGEAEYALSIGVNTIGRMPDNSVVIEDSHISRHHCAIIVRPNGNCEVHDIASKNGTILNGKVIAEPTPMKPGDILNLSNRRIVLRARLAPVDEDTPLPDQGGVNR